MGPRRHIDVSMDTFSHRQSGVLLGQTFRDTLPTQR
jgi:hypothetical protein